MNRCQANNDIPFVNIDVNNMLRSLNMWTHDMVGQIADVISPNDLIIAVGDIIFSNIEGQSGR